MDCAFPCWWLGVPVWKKTSPQGLCRDPPPLSTLGMRHGCPQPLSPPWSVPSKTYATLSDKCVLIPTQQETLKGMILIYFSFPLTVIK